MGSPLQLSSVPPYSCTQKRGPRTLNESGNGCAEKKLQCFEELVEALGCSANAITRIGVPLRSNFSSNPRLWNSHFSTPVTVTASSTFLLSYSLEGAFVEKLLHNGSATRRVDRTPHVEGHPHFACGRLATPCLW
ncbi:hypothetical protein OPV22_021764 [Ensete ventricosum]|uniref:Uncharacterized protein n=1 Tax=Ensete ventricosum TaxID=4639 RepID=A0AAV8QP97_ENSVE|nr:hypothetical protein OPV22_021764 [Ensete ventricosum]